MLLTDRRVCDAHCEALGVYYRSGQWQNTNTEAAGGKGERKQPFDMLQEEWPRKYELEKGKNRIKICQWWAECGCFLVPTEAYQIRMIGQFA